MPHHPTSPRVASLAAVVALAAAVTAAAASGPAYAVSDVVISHLTCPNTPSPALCQETFRLVAPETIKVTVDKLNPSTQLYSWTITDSRGVVRCRQSYLASDPARTWLCTLPAGTSTFSTPAFEGPTTVTLTF